MFNSDLALNNGKERYTAKREPYRTKIRTIGSDCTIRETYISQRYGVGMVMSIGFNSRRTHRNAPNFGANIKVDEVCTRAEKTRQKRNITM